MDRQGTAIRGWGFILWGVICAVCGSAGLLGQTGRRDADVESLRQLIAQYATAVDEASTERAEQIWSHATDVSFIFPLGEAHGLEEIEQKVYRDAMGGLFSERDLKIAEPAIHVDGEMAWSEFHWRFHAKQRKDGSPVVSEGVETQIYRKEAGRWRLVHVHYSGAVVSGNRTTP